MSIFNYDKFEKNLPDAFRKDKDSNNYKLLLVEKHIYDKINAMLQSVFEIMNIDNATGKVLDLYGERVNLTRGKATDAQYLIRLKAKIALNFSDGSYDYVSRGLAFVLSSTPDKIKLKEGGNNTIHIIDLPLSVLTDAKFSADQFIEIVEDMLPEGVIVARKELTGTFEFGGADGELDNDKGFADLDGTVGGYFGLI